MSRTSTTSRVASYAVLTLGAVLVAFPFFWMVSTSLKTREETNRIPPKLLPADPQWENYPDAWVRPGAALKVTFTRMFVNSLLVAVCVTAGTLVTSILAAYAFVFMRFPGRGVLFVLFLSTMMIPFEVALVPNVGTIRALGLENSYGALIVPWLANVFSIFILRQCFRTIPSDYWDAARIDGCGHWRFMWQIATPMAAPALVTITIFTFLGSWNAFLWPLVVTDPGGTKVVVQFGLSLFEGQESTAYHTLMAASAIVIIPVVVLYLILQRRFIEGVAGTGLKG
jgi:multiple sugar transport system permease protein